MPTTRRPLSATSSTASGSRAQPRSESACSGTVESGLAACHTLTAPPISLVRARRTLLIAPVLQQPPNWDPQRGGRWRVSGPASGRAVTVGKLGHKPAASDGRLSRLGFPASQTRSSASRPRCSTARQNDLICTATHSRRSRPLKHRTADLARRPPTSTVTECEVNRARRAARIA